MAISPSGSAVDSYFFGQSTSVTLTIASDDDYIVAFVGSDSATASAGAVVLDPGGTDEATFNGPDVSRENTGAISYIYHLRGGSIPPAGDYTVEVTLDGDPGAAHLTVQAMSGAADQAPEATAGDTLSGTSVSTPITTLTDGAYLFDLLAHRAGESADSDLSADSGQTEIAKAGTLSNAYGSSYKEVPSAGSDSMGWSWSTSTDIAHTIIAVAPASTGGGGGTSSDLGITALNFAPQDLTASTAGGISVSLGTVALNLDTGASLGVNHELSPVAFDLAPQVLQVAGEGLSVPLGTVTFGLSPQELSWVRERALGVAAFSLSPQLITIGAVEGDTPHLIFVSRNVSRDPDSPSSYTPTGT